MPKVYLTELVDSAYPHQSPQHTKLTSVLLEDDDITFSNVILNVFRRLGNQKPNWVTLTLAQIYNWLADNKISQNRNIPLKIAEKDKKYETSTWFLEYHDKKEHRNELDSLQRNCVQS